MSVIPRNTGLTPPQLAQISLPSWFPFGNNRPPCPNPHDFYRAAMNNINQSVRSMEIAKSWVPSLDDLAPDAIALNLNNVSGHNLQTKELLKKFKQDWDDCGTEEPLPAVVSEVEQNLNLVEEEMGRLKEVQEAMERGDNNLSFHAAVENGIAIVLSLLAGIAGLLNELPSPAGGH
jgi:hypothetical protein